MELKLEQIVSVFELIRSVDGYSVMLWLSFLIPLFYIVFKKLTYKPEDTTTGITARLINMVQLPAMDTRVLRLSLALFILGVASVKVGQYIKEEHRKAGLRVKNYLTDKNYYYMPVKDVAKNTKLKRSVIENLAKEYPSEFSITPGFDLKNHYSPNLLLTDSATLKNILDKSEKLLDTYLGQPAMLPSMPGQSVSFDTVFNRNNFFTNRVFFQLIAHKPAKYALAGTLTQPAIVLLDVSAAGLAALEAFMDHEPADSTMLIDSVYHKNHFFTQQVVMALAATHNDKYRLTCDCRGKTGISKNKLIKTEQDGK